MRPYVRERLSLDEQELLTAEPPRAETVSVTATNISPLQELLLLHPAPWQCLPHRGWRGKETPDDVVFDGLGYPVDVVDDPRWARALCEAVNTAAGTLASIQELDRLCAGANGREGVKNHE